MRVILTIHFCLGILACTPSSFAATFEVLFSLGRHGGNVMASDDGSIVLSEISYGDHDTYLWQAGKGIIAVYPRGSAHRYGMSGDGQHILETPYPSTFAGTDASYDGSVVVGGGCT